MKYYYNENDPKAADWLEHLAAADLILGGMIDRKSITDVTADQLEGFRQCHFFAGIGGWCEALRLAGWPDAVPVWTGSCPCQPFSAAGRQRGTDDARHLWPDFRRLIDECHPPVVFGEQVASKLGREWLAAVRADLEALGYAVGAADLCAAGAGAPHIRQRLFWVAYAASLPRAQHERESRGRVSTAKDAAVDSGDCFGVGNAIGPGSQRHPWHGDNGNQSRRVNQNTERPASTASDPCRLGNTESNGRKQGITVGAGSNAGTETQRESGRIARYGCDCGLANTSDERYRAIPDSASGGGESERCGVWSDVEFVPCRDGKARPVKPGIRLLAHGVPGRVAQLRGLGNAIVPQVAAVFVRSFLECVTLEVA